MISDGQEGWECHRRPSRQPGRADYTVLAGMTKEMFTKADNYVLQFRRPLEEPLRPRDRRRRCSRHSVQAEIELSCSWVPSEASSDHGTGAAPISSALVVRVLRDKDGAVLVGAGDDGSLVGLITRRS